MFRPGDIYTHAHAGGGRRELSKFLALGMPLTDVVLRSTWNPAKEIELERLANLSVGAPGCELTVRDDAVVYDLNEAWDRMAPPPPRRQAPLPQQ
jgi:hypothetical protein